MQVIMTVFLISFWLICFYFIGKAMKPKGNVVSAKKSVWAWGFLGVTSVILAILGPGFLVLPLLPLLLAGFSQDAGPTAAYIPFGIIFGGYGLMIFWGWGVYKALKRIRR